MTLTSSVAEEVHGPTKDLLQSGSPKGRDRGLFNCLAELLTTDSRDATLSARYLDKTTLNPLDAERLALLLALRETELFTGAGNKDFIAGQVASGGVVTAVLGG